MPEEQDGPIPIETTEADEVMTPPPADREQVDTGDAIARLNESLTRVPDPELRRVLRQMVTVETLTHRGPLPPAKELVAYDKALPGLAREIVNSANVEQIHRHAMDRRTGTQEFILNIGGLVAMLLALLMMLAVVAYMASKDHAVEAAALGGAVIVGVTVALSNFRKAAPTPMPPATPAEKSD